MISSQKEEFDTFYSPCGYIQVNKAQYNDSNININCYQNMEFCGSWNKAQLSKKITIYLKTFYDKRNKYPLTVSIDEPIYELIYYLISAEANQSNETFNINQQYRLLSSRGTLRELSPYNTYVDENIQDQEILVIVSPETMKFSETMKTSHIYLENKRRSAIKMDTDDIEFCWAEPGFKFGKRYIEFLLESEPIDRNIMIGVSTARDNYKFKDSKCFYGFLLSECKIVYNREDKMELSDFGFETKIGDKIGMLIDWTRQDREVTYFVNNILVGTAFKNWPFEILYPCVCLGFAGTRVMMNSKIDFPTN